jgi:hypothetical protein
MLTKKFVADIVLLYEVTKQLFIRTILVGDLGPAAISKNALTARHSRIYLQQYPKTYSQVLPLSEGLAQPVRVQDRCPWLNLDPWPQSRVLGFACRRMAVS